MTSKPFLSGVGSPGEESFPASSGTDQDKPEPALLPAAEAGGFRARDPSLNALALQWILRNPRVSMVIAGAATPAELEANVRAVSSPLPAELWDEYERREIGSHP
jgi:aryl-alcohol dehydrogenase-like predicted oxidoreductase